MRTHETQSQSRNPVSGGIAGKKKKKKGEKKILQRRAVEERNIYIRGTPERMHYRFTTKMISRRTRAQNTIPDGSHVPGCFVPFFFSPSLPVILFINDLFVARAQLMIGEIYIDYFDSCNFTLRGRIIWKQYSWIMDDTTRVIVQRYWMLPIELN